MSKLQQFKDVLLGLDFKESKKNIFTKVYTKTIEEDGKKQKVSMGMMYKITPKKIKFYMIDSLGHSHLNMTSAIKDLKFNDDGIDTENWKEYKGKEKSKQFDFNKL